LNKREREIATVKTNSIEQQINNEKKKHLNKKKTFTNNYFWSVDA